MVVLETIGELLYVGQVVVAVDLLDPGGELWRCRIIVAKPRMWPEVA